MIHPFFDRCEHCGRAPPLWRRLASLRWGPLAEDTAYRQRAIALGAGFFGVGLLAGMVLDAAGVPHEGRQAVGFLYATSAALMLWCVVAFVQFAAFVGRGR